MYQAIYYDRQEEEIHVWDDETGYDVVSFQEYGYMKDRRGDHVSLTGERCRLAYPDEWNETDLDKGIVFETNVPATTRYLVDTYGESDNIPEHHRIVSYDIEIEKSDRGYVSDIEQDPFNKIISIALYDYQTKEYWIYIVDEDSKMKDSTTKNRNLVACTSETDLLTKFFVKWEEINPTIVTGWNIDYFDNPYMYYRTKRVLGSKFANRLSPIRKIRKNRPNRFGQSSITIAGISSLDSMRLYKKFTFGEKPSYALDYISNLELNRGKVEYSGSLQQLYETDPDKFIEYNVIDVELVVDIESKKDLIGQVLGICHKGHVPYEDIYYSSKYLEGASLTFMKRIGIVAPAKKKKYSLELQDIHAKGDMIIKMSNKIDDQIPGAGFLKIIKSKSSDFEIKFKKWDKDTFYLEEPLPETVYPKYEVKLGLPGAYVKEPTPGLYDWLYDLDLTSLYPSIIMTLNISPETKVGKILDWNAHDYVKSIDRTYQLQIGRKTETKTFEEIKDFLKSTKYKIAANGVFYKHPDEQKGFLPTILEKWFDERAEYKTEMKKYGKLGDSDKEKFFHMKQLVAKVLLNSFYGVLGLQSFRFHDIDNAEAITLTGQQLIKFTSQMANYYYTNQLGKSDEYVIYTDTDSIFVLAEPMVKKLYPELDLNRSKTTMEIHDTDSWISDLVTYLGGGKILDDKVELVSGKIIPKKALNLWIDKKLDHESVAHEMKVTEAIIDIASKTQTFINKSYDTYASRFHNSDSHRFDIKQELVSKSGFWVAKKRYCQWVVNSEGTPADELDVKGLDVVRSNFPKAFQIFMKGILNDILRGMTKEDMVDKILNYKRDLSKLPLYDIMTPGSINDYTKYIDEDSIDQGTLFSGRLKGATAAAKATMNHNDLIEDMKLKHVAPIMNGDKIKWCYLKSHNPYRLESLALKGYDDPDQLVEYIKDYIDYSSIYDSQLKKKLDAFFEALNWGSVPVNRLKNKFFTFH